MALVLVYRRSEDGVRRDATVVCKVAFAIPREITKALGIGRAGDFMSAEFVDRGKASARQMASISRYVLKGKPPA